MLQTGKGGKERRGGGEGRGWERRDVPEIWLSKVQDWGQAYILLGYKAKETKETHGTLCNWKKQKDKTEEDQRRLKLINSI